MARNYQRWSEAELMRLRALAEKHQSPRILTTLNEEFAHVRPPRGISSLRTKIQQLGLKTPPNGGTYEAPPEAGSTFASPLTKKPLSVEDVVALFKIDLDIWEATHVAPNVWMIGSKHPETGQILTAPLYQTKVTFKRKPEASAAKLAAQLMADIKADRKVRPKRLTIVTKKDGEPHALEIDEFDIHLNKLSWAAESGQDYDSAIAEERARTAMLDLLSQSSPYRIERIILPIGNDLTNADNLGNTTTAGTPQDTDTRYHRMFRRGVGLTHWMIEQCVQVAPTEVVIVPGNHDELTAWTIGQVLVARWDGDKRVTFQDGPKLRKYVHYWQNLIGFTHGSDEPHTNLPQIMAVEQSAVWGQTSYREWHVGHLHKQKATQPIMVDDKIGVTVRIIRALTGTDKWHFRKGYVGGTQGAEAFIWKRSGGLRAHLYHTSALDGAA